MNKLYIITGSSGIGKSTLIPILKNDLPNIYDIHDFDEKLTEEVAMDGNLLGAWRKETTKYWIGRALENGKINKSTVILGLIYPDEVIEMNQQISVAFCLLDASEEKIRERLMGKRFSTPERIAGLKKAINQSQNEFIEQNKLLLEKLRDEIKNANGTIIDTTNDTPSQTASKITDWVENRRRFP